MFDLVVSISGYALGKIYTIWFSVQNFLP